MNFLQTGLPNLNNSAILSELDKQIRIKYYKEGNKNKTCVYGLFDFITEPEGKLLIKYIKKKLGCAGIIEDEKESTPASNGATGPPISKDKEPKDGKNKIMIFSGKHVEEIKNIILDKKITNDAHIKI